MGQILWRLYYLKPFQHTTIVMLGNTYNKDFQACMLLAAVGDAMGYKNGDWEFLTNGNILHAQMMKLTDNKGPLALVIDLQWRYSDDTVMHIATAKALALTNKESTVEDICRRIAVEYKECWKRMANRAPGHTTAKSVSILQVDGSNWNKIPYQDKAGGCGGSMRAACIGLALKDMDTIIGVAVQAGRITHHNPIGYLGSVVAACFTHYALMKINPLIWGALLFEEVLPKAKSYIQKVGREVEMNMGKCWNYFEKAWKDYLQLRNLTLDSKSPQAARFPEPYGIKERQQFYKDISFSGWGGASGHDSVIIAYDAILGCNGSWEQLCLRAILHGGDNDSTGTIGGAWFGALWGLKGVPDNHVNNVEDVNLLKALASKLLAVRSDL